MQQSQTKIINTKTQTTSVASKGAVLLTFCPGWIFGGGFLPKAGVLGVLLGAGLLPALGQAIQLQYRFTEIRLPAGSEALGINDNGLVTGSYPDPVTGDYLSYLFEGDRLTTGIEKPGATDTILGPANNFGVESGNYGDETNQQPAFYDIRRGTFTPLPDIPGMPYNAADGINDFGHAVGVAYASGNINTGGNGLGLNWFWNGRDYSFFTVPGATDGAVDGGLNDWDQISGLYVDNTGTPHGFFKDGTNYTTLSVPGAAYTIGYGLNNGGVVTGYYVNPDTILHGFVWRAGQFSTVDANVSGAIGTAWVGLNDNGDLAGVYFDTNNVQHAVIALRGDRDGYCGFDH
ncbi:MAG: hypothetical protein ABSH48_21115 [Verrucomicrobiota bacterium]